MGEVKPRAPLPWRKVLPVSAVMFFSEFAHGGLLLGLLPRYLPESYGLGLDRVGLLISLYYLAEFLLKAPAGALVDRLGRRPTLLLAIVGSGVTLLGIARAPSAHWLTVLLPLHGCCAAPIWPAILARIGDSVGEEDRGSAMGVLFTAWLGGMGLGFVTTIVARHLEAWRLFPLLGGSWCAAFVLGAILVARAARSGEASARPAAPSPFRALGMLARTFGRSWLLVIGLFLQTFCLGLLVPVIERFASTVRGLTQGEVLALLFGGGGLALVLMAPLGRLADRWDPKLVLVSSLAVAGAAVGLFGVVTPFAALLALVGIAGASYALILPTWNKVLLAHAPEAIRATALSAFMAVEQSGIAAGPVVSGVLWERVGQTAPFLAAGAILVAMACAYVATPRSYLAGGSD